jgi:hypothetical protein
VTVFKEMDPELAWKAIEGQKDILTSEAEKQDAFYQQFTCPRCQCHLTKEFDPRTAFSGGSLIAKALLKCDNCGYRIEPHTRVVVNFGDASKIPVEVLPILGGKYIEDP